MKTSKLLTVAVCAAGMLVLAAPALGQDQGAYGDASKATNERFKRIEKDLREVRAIVLQAKATGQPVEVRTASSDDQLTAMQAKLDDLEQTLRGLTGQVETLSHAADMAKSDAAASQAQMAALSDRLDKVEKQLAAMAPPPPPPPAPGAPAQGADAGDAGGGSGDANAAYSKARQTLLNGDYPAAGDAFQSFLDTYPTNANAPAARYWLGEVKYTLGDYGAAASSLVGSIRGWPKTAWAPDAMVKLALSLVQLNKSPDACTTLTELRRHYPTAPSATKARAAAAKAKAGCKG
jgi:tol-pal system protein YbgF